MLNTILEDPGASLVTFQDINLWNSLLQAAELMMIL